MKNDQDHLEMTPEQKHQKQFLLEICLPIMLSLVVFLGIFILFVTLTSNDGGAISKLADISIIFMIIPLFLIMVVGTLVLFYLNRAVHGWNKSLPVFFNNVQRIANQAAMTIQAIATKVALPVIRSKSILQGVRKFFTSILRIDS